ncbi:MAG: FHA domain-containing protein [Acidobacteriota bacterium]
MIITCPQCSAQYRYDEARFGDSPRRKVKCPKCSHIFDITNPSGDTGDPTYIAKGQTQEEGASPDDHQTDKTFLEPEDPELPPLAPLRADLRFSLAVIAGAQAGSVFKITNPRVYLGRGTSADIQLRDAEISRRHAMIEIRGDEVTVVDQGATNGCFVEGARVESAVLEHQMEFTLGSTTLMLIITSTSGNTV